MAVSADSYSEVFSSLARVSSERIVASSRSSSVIRAVAAGPAGVPLDPEDDTTVAEDVESDGEVKNR